MSAKAESNFSFIVGRTNPVFVVSVVMAEVEFTGVVFVVVGGFLIEAGVFETEVVGMVLVVVVVTILIMPDEGPAIAKGALFEVGTGTDFFPLPFLFPSSLFNLSLIENSDST